MAIKRFLFIYTEVFIMFETYASIFVRCIRREWPLNRNMTASMDAARRDVSDPLVSIVDCGNDTLCLLYARLHTENIMVWRFPCGSQSVRPTLHQGIRPPVFRTFHLHALTYWAEILHMTLFWCTTDQVWVSTICINFWRRYVSFWS